MNSSALDLPFDPGSFRDRHGRVFLHENRVFRTLSGEGLQDWNDLATSAFLQQQIKQGNVVQTQLLPSEEIDRWTKDGQWAGVLEHERIPFISYPYEWCFEMLKDAALLQLRLLRGALPEGRILKDSSSFNYQWIGAKPVLIDVLSMKRLHPGETWVGYRQFCQMFLYPLLLETYKDIPMQPLLRGSVEGIAPELCSRFFTRFDLFRAGVLKHVYLQSKLQQKYAATDRNVSSELRNAGFSKQLIEANASSLSRLIERLHYKKEASVWSEYECGHSYTGEDRQRKETFVASALGTKRWSLVWDLGCNVGVFSRIAARSSNYVVAMDSDARSIDRLYVELKKEGAASILPLVVNVADLPGGMGWRATERKALPDRGKPDICLCLALIHHLVIAANIPMQELIRWFSDLRASLIIEFIDREDPMVQRLMRNKEETYQDYTKESFESILRQYFEVRETVTLASKTRTLYFATPR